MIEAGANKSAGTAHFSTPDLCDEHPDHVQVLELNLQDFGGSRIFSGSIVTVQCFEDNSKVKALAATPGHGKVMVVDGGGSLRRALLGDMIAEQAVNNGWAGLVINGCVRDVEILATLYLGVKAIQACPMKTHKRDLGDVDVEVRFGGITIFPGQYLFADANGVLVAKKNLLA
ncbi:putative 4-hydroxy-4-methyl-2-oxoglutarate aldolase [Simiduia sp. 21SJ11W-1]|uniref:putative 4-hydroxy-4-methyl-2-oxoglutarate aldolase n=1 Tax=Simiduia sp. 21SJ11W-1 TaxID=2909669 RepID=UPI00209EC9D8|nr:putative 4-hydroxy-4-methyl-2-oxoglutarate aldolase [Simiduia sp. 21SJ11W-1]UTA49599.1 putative 4-hydroxy-4-methyl-2-oxoglutarate aldolase [Simiduia sp. 21SJ11W-1]